MASVQNLGLKMIFDYSNNDEWTYPQEKVIRRVHHGF